MAEVALGRPDEGSLLTDNLRGFVRDVAATALTRAVGIVVGVITLTTTTRLLGPEGRGQFAIALACLGFVLQFGHLGLHSSSTYHLARLPSSRHAVTGLLALYAFVGVSVLAALFALIVAALPGLVPNVAPQLVGLALCAAPPAIFVTLAGSSWLGLGRPGLYNGLDLAGKGAGLVAVALLVWWPMPAFFLAYAVLYYGIALWAYVSLVGWSRPVADLGVSRALVSFGSRMFATNVFMYLVLRLDLFLVNAWIGSADAGRFSVAVQVSELLLQATAAVTAMLFPRLAAMTPEARWRSTWRATRWMAACLAVAASGLAVLGDVVFPVAFGASFAAAVTPFVLLLPGLCCLALNSILLQHMAASGMPWVPVLATALAVVLKLAANVLLIPTYGMAGAATAASVTYALLFASSVVYVRSNRPPVLVSEV